MKTIKDQISTIIVFNATTLSNLNDEYSTIRERLCEGLDKMQAANIFSKAEIEDVRTYMYEVLNSRYTCAQTDIVNKLRAEFTF